MVSVAKEEEKVMTLDEWKAQEDVKRAKADFNIRKAGEGCSGDPQWKKMVVLTKKEKTEDAEDEEELVRNLILKAGPVTGALLQSQVMLSSC